MTDFTQLAIFSTVQLIIWRLLPDAPIEDEVIHVKQAEYYWAGEFGNWDPRITTPPGLYITSLLLKIPFKHVTKPSVRLFRLVNILFGIGIAYLAGTNIAVVPILFPYTHLYYTDAGSLFFVLLADKLFVKGNFFLSANVGLISLLFRQTNIVWIGRLVLLRFVDIIEDRITFWSILLAIGDVSPYVMVIVLFLGFVIANKGVVLGDRDSHRACFNIPQLTYCILIYNMYVTNCLAFCFTYVLHLAVFNRFESRHPYHDHQNSHITTKLMHLFIYNRYLRNLVLVPIVLIEKAVCEKYMDSQGYLRSAIFLVCTILATVPSPLVEPRYYIIPAIMFMIHTGEDRIKTSTIWMNLLLVMLILIPSRLGVKPIIW